MVLADIYIPTFSDIIIAFVNTLAINMQIKHFLLTVRCLSAPHAKFSLAGCIKVHFKDQPTLIPALGPKVGPRAEKLQLSTVWPCHTP